MAGEKNSKYKPEYDEQARKLVLSGVTDEQLCIFFKIGLDELALWAHQNESFFNAITPDKLEIEEYTSKVEAKKKKRREWKRNHFELNPARKIERATRARVHAATSGRTAGISGMPFTIGELKSHLESLFTEGMSWDNYGKWHIDHIKPCSLFNHEIKSDFIECWSLKNLQPLWASENIKKGDKYASA